VIDDDEEERKMLAKLWAETERKIDLITRPMFTDEYLRDPFGFKNSANYL